MDTRL